MPAKEARGTIISLKTQKLSIKESSYPTELKQKHQQCRNELPEKCTLRRKCLEMLLKYNPETIQRLQRIQRQALVFLLTAS